MKLSIIIVNYFSKNLVRESLKKLFGQNFCFEWEVIVVDNSPREGLGKKIVSEFPHVKHVASEKNLGFAAGNNIGLRQAKGDFLLILNPDIFVGESSLESLMSYLDSNRGVGLIAPQLLNPNGSIQYSCHHFPKWFMPILRRTFLGNFVWAKKYLDYYEMKYWDHLSEKEIDWAMGACLMVRRDAMEKVGHMDDGYFLYFEDTDWCRRFWRAGFKVMYLPQAKMFHFHKRASKFPVIFSVFNKPSRAHIKSALKYFWKWRNSSLTAGKAGI